MSNCIAVGSNSTKLVHSIGTIVSSVILQVGKMLHVWVHTYTYDYYCIMGIVRGRKSSRISWIWMHSRMFSCTFYLGRDFFIRDCLNRVSFLANYCKEGNSRNFSSADDSRYTVYNYYICISTSTHVAFQVSPHLGLCYHPYLCKRYQCMHYILIMSNFNDLNMYWQPACSKTSNN